MGHSINYYDTKATTKKNLKAWLSAITGNAYDPHETCGYHGNLAIHDDVVYRNREAAEEAIERFDTGWYSDHVVKFRELTREGRLKQQQVFDKRDEYILAHSIHKRTSAFVGCPECKSKLFLAYIKGEKCPLCHTDLRPASTIEKIKWYDRKAKEVAEKDTEERWLAKIEYHC